MKIASFLATALFAVSAFAGKTYIHDYDAALRGIALDNACITSTEVKTIKPVRHCVNMVAVHHGQSADDSYTDWVCEKWETAQLAFPRAFEKTVCTQVVNNEAYSGCVATAVVQDFLPATINVRVVSDVGGEAGSDYPGVQTTFTFPACSK